MHHTLDNEFQGESRACCPLDDPVPVGNQGGRGGHVGVGLWGGSGISPDYPHLVAHVEGSEVRSECLG